MVLAVGCGRQHCSNSSSFLSFIILQKLYRPHLLVKISLLLIGKLGTILLVESDGLERRQLG